MLYCNVLLTFPEKGIHLSGSGIVHKMLFNVYPLQRHMGCHILLCNFIEHTLDHYTKESFYTFMEFPSNDVAQGLTGKTKNLTFPKFPFLFLINTDYVDICILFLLSMT